MFYDSKIGRGEREEESENRGKCDVGIPQAREMTIRAFSGSW